VPKHNQKNSKKEKENCISSPIFASDPQFFDFDPSFSDITKIRNEGTKSEQGTRLGTGLERSLRKTLVSMERKVS
jgi:hypothetical protein